MVLRLRFKIILMSILIVPVFSVQAKEWQAKILPRESREVMDADTGAKVVFVTTDPASDTNLYFHERSWLPDESLLFFISDRFGRSEPMAWIEKTGELVQLCPEGEEPGFGFTASRKSNCLYLIKSDGIYEWSISSTINERPEQEPSQVALKERKIASIPDKRSPAGSLNENADSSKLSLLLKHTDSDQTDIVFFDIKNGELEIITTVSHPASHLQCNNSNPNLVMYACTFPEGDRVPLFTKKEYANREPRTRIWFAELGKPEPWRLHLQIPGELVTHECWWLGDTLTFCGGMLPNESHLKTADCRTGEIRILGPARWWKDIPEADLMRYHWWHGAGSPTGEWAAADTFHGDIVLFNAKTTEMQPLALNHRTYGGGAHPHVGWSPSGRMVVFASNRNGKPDVCVAYVEPLDKKAH